MQKHYPRMFIGLDLAAKDKLAIDQWREKYLKGLPGNLVPVENFHITLSFLGQITPDKMESLHNLLTGIKAETLHLSTADIGYFQKPQVLYLGIETSEALSDLAQQCLSINSSLGISKQHSNYRPHVTIMRKHKVATPIQVPLPHLNLKFEQFHLFESISSHKPGTPVHYQKKLSFDLIPKLIKDS